MESSERSAYAWYLVAMIASGSACGGSHAAADAGPADSPRPSVVRVSPDGSDTGDGTTQPVATLSRAIALAEQHPEITDIELLAGRYEMPHDELGQYLPPATVQRIAGPPGGGATLVGSGSGDGRLGLSGLVISSGRVENLDFDSFHTAIEASGTVALANLHFTNVGRAILATINDTNGVITKPKLRIDNVDIARGDMPADVCVIGVSIEFDGELTISGLTTHAMGIAIAGPFGANIPPATINVTSSNLGATGDFVTCTSSVLPLGNSTATLKDVVLDGGSYGIDSYDAAMVTIQGGMVRSQQTGIGGGGSYQITDTMVTGSSTGIIIGHSSSLSGVTITNNGVGLAAGGFDAANPVVLTMRNSTVSGNHQDGVRISNAIHVDLGTAASPGGNTIQGNTGAGLAVVSDDGSPTVNASGNTWNASVQGADSDGRYILVETLAGPIAASPGNNFAIAAGSSLTR